MSAVLCVWCSVEISSFTIILQVNRLSAWHLTTSTGNSIHTGCYTGTILTLTTVYGRLNKL